MRKGMLAVVCLALLLVVMVPSGCVEKKPVQADTLHVDSVLTDTLADDSAESVISETPMPKAADELFDDFVFNFVANRKLQQSRIAFPLQVYRNGEPEKKIEKGQWKVEHFFMRQEYYTLIFGSEKEKSLVKDTTVDHVTIEKIFFDKRLVQSFLFDRIDGKWMMTAVHYDAMQHNPNASFLTFYHHFSTDSLYQIESMADEVEFTAPDPMDDFSTITGVIVPQQWHDFKPGLIPKGIMYNILYGRKHPKSDKRLLVIRGIANGLEMEMNFKKMGGEWKLYRFYS